MRSASTSASPRAALRRHSLLLVALLAFAPVLPAVAQDAASESGPPNWAYTMAHDLMSPFCPGRTLAACPSPQADQLRQWILFQAAAGQSREEIEASLFERFGNVILSAPRAEGWGLSAYAIPVGAFLIGGALVAFILRSLVRSPGRRSAPGAPVGKTAPLPAAGPEIDSELERLVDEELARR